jgi:hypothetical protein
MPPAIIDVAERPHVAGTKPLRNVKGCSIHEKQNDGNQGRQIHRQQQQLTGRIIFLLIKVRFQYVLHAETQSEPTKIQIHIDK